MKFNDSFIDSVGKGPGVTRLVSEITDDIAAIARGTAPVDEGDYRDGIESNVHTTAHRAVGLVTATDPKSLIIESKTGNLVRALNAKKRG